MAPRMLFAQSSTTSNSLVRSRRRSSAKTTKMIKLIMMQISTNVCDSRRHRSDRKDRQVLVSKTLPFFSKTLPFRAGALVSSYNLMFYRGDKCFSLLKTFHVCCIARSRSHELHSGESSGGRLTSKKGDRMVESMQLRTGESAPKTPSDLPCRPVVTSKTLSLPSPASKV